MRPRLFGLEAELAVSAQRDSKAFDLLTVGLALSTAAQRSLVHLSGVNGRMFFPNGGLFYLDCGAHPEVATPECTTPWEAVSYLRAGERMVAGLARLARAEIGAEELLVHRSNVDYATGATWGCHESYLGKRPVAAYRNWLVPHLASRIIYTGSGGLDPLSPGIRFSLSPRVSHLKHVVSSQSTAERGIFHTRDEPLCAGHRRIHVLAGDNTCSQRATWLKMGTTALMVALADACGPNVALLRLENPVSAMRGFARDIRHRASVVSSDGTSFSMCALELQRHLLSRIDAYGERADLPEWTPAVCAALRETLDLVETRALRDSLAFDWPLKFMLMQREAARRGFTEPMIAAWSDAVEHVWRPDAAPADKFGCLSPAHLERLRGVGAVTRKDMDEATRMLETRGLSWQGLEEFNALRRQLCAIDVRFGELESGIFERLDRQGVIPDHRMVTEAQIAAAATEAPPASRAALRGYWVKRLARRGSRYTCDWQSIHGPHLRLDLSDPFATSATWDRVRRTRLSDSMFELLRGGLVYR